MNDLISDYDIRQLVRINDMIISSEITQNDSSYLFELIPNLEGLLSSFNEIDVNWLEKLRKQWWKLELTRALLIDENRKKLTNEEFDIIKKSLTEMQILVESQLVNAGKKNEQLPPWEKYRDIPPYDGFWRQPGDLWMGYVWLPFWDSLSEPEQEKYLKRWNAPDNWIANIQLGKLLDELDE